ncbi:MAG: hypothetical protein HY390_00065 [Deltaproteobacteria bacterium]|nr:hypothetical protein [Deltaproteobacteria bacterium]
MNKTQALFWILIFWMTGCGTDPSSRPVSNPLILELTVFDLKTQSTNASETLNTIAYYQFNFTGEKFPDVIEKKIERKPYVTYEFSDIPYDSHLEISVRALNIDHQPLNCHGKITIDYHAGKCDRLSLPLNCL